MLLDYLDKRIIELEKVADIKDLMSCEYDDQMIRFDLKCAADVQRMAANELRKMREMLVTEYVPIWKRILTP